MNATTVKAIHKQTAKLLPIVEQLSLVWDSPIIAMCGVLVQNLAFDGSDCSNYTLENDVQKIEAIHKAIKLLKENSFRDTFIEWLWLEMDSIIVGNMMSEDYD
jgi:hypothetical protein